MIEAKAFFNKQYALVLCGCGKGLVVWEGEGFAVFSRERGSLEAEVSDRCVHCGDTIPVIRERGERNDVAI